MIKTIHAIFEHGTLRPLEPIEGIKENTEVELTIVTKEPIHHPLAEICGIMPKEDAEEMLRIIEDEFEKVTPDEADSPTLKCSAGLSASFGRSILMRFNGVYPAVCPT